MHLFVMNEKNNYKFIHGYGLLEFLLASTLMAALLGIVLYVCSDLSTARGSLHHMYQMNDNERILSLNVLSMLNQYQQMDESYRQLHPIKLMPATLAPSFIHASLVKTSNVILLPIDAPFPSNHLCSMIALYVARSTLGQESLYVKCPNQRAEVLSSRVKDMRLGVAQFQLSGGYQIYLDIGKSIVLKPNDILILHFLIEEPLLKTRAHRYYFFYKYHDVLDKNRYQDLPIFWQYK